MEQCWTPIGPECKCNMNCACLWLHTLCWMTVFICMFAACLNVLSCALQRVVGTADACIFNCQTSGRVTGWGLWTEAELNPATLSCHCLTAFLTLLTVFLFLSSVFLPGWVVLADLHWDTAIVLIALICQRAFVVAGEHSNITPKHCGGAMWMLLSSPWWLRVELSRMNRQASFYTHKK